jgi:hypothetical protein
VRFQRIRCGLASRPICCQGTRLVLIMASLAMLIPAIYFHRSHWMTARPALESTSPMGDPGTGKRGKYPRAFAQTYSHDFGTVAPSEKLATNFKITNGSDAVLHLTVANKSCGCTSAWIEPEAIEPSESALLSVEFSMPDRPGRIAHFVDVETDEADNAKMRFTFAAHAEWGVEAFPSEIYAGAMLPGTTFSSEIELASAEDMAFDVTSIEPTDDWLSVAPLDDARRKRFRLTVSRPGEPGPFEGLISFATTSERRPSLSVRVRGQAATGAVAWPERLVLGSREGGSEVDVELVLQAPNNQAEFGVDRIEIAGANWAVENWSRRLSNPKALGLKIRVRVPRDVGYQRAILVVKFHGAREPIETPISCLVQ